MAFNYYTGQWEPGGFQGAGLPMPDQGLNYTYGNNGPYPPPNAPGTNPYTPGMIGDGSVPGGNRPPGLVTPYPTDDPSQRGYGGGPLPGQPMDPTSPYFQQWLQSHSGNPTAPNPYSDNSGVPITGTTNPNGVNFNRPTVVPPLTNSQPAPVTSGLPMPTGNPGNDPNNPPGPGYFWSGTAGHWVDPTGQHDATGRALDPTEQTYWHGYDQRRASNILTPQDASMMKWGNMTLPNGVTQPAMQTPVPVAAAPAPVAAPVAAPVQAAVAAQPQYKSNVYGDANGHASFAELAGVVDPARLQAAINVYGWQQGPTGIASQQEADAQADALSSAHPEYDYQKVQLADGSYTIMAREQDQKAQVARGYTPAGMQQPHPVSSTYSGGGGGGKSTYKGSSYKSSGSSYKSSGGGYTTPKPVAAPAAPPQGKTTIQPGPALDTRMVGGSVNMNQPVEGQIISYNGQMVQFRNGRWVPYAYQGGGNHPVPV